MRLLRITLLFTSLCCAHEKSDAQTSATDSITFEQFKEMVLENHPVVKQANLNLMRGERAVQMSRGAFDPKLGATYANKFFQNKEYYNLQSVNLDIATPSPLYLKGGFERNTGDYFNPESSTPDDGLLIAGVSVPVLRGLITDERRTALRVAKAFREYSMLEQRVVINSLLAEAYDQYWLWWNAYEKSMIAESILSISMQRMEAIKERAMMGDLSPIDTLEAYTQVQNRLQISQEASAQEVKARMMLSSYLWSVDEDENKAFVIPKGIKPSVYSLIQNSINEQAILKSYLDSLMESNPVLAQYEWKYESLRAEERWKKEKLKPTLNVNYNLLSENFSSTDNAGFSTENYKWGFDFSFPLFIRKERGDLALTRIKILETDYELQRKSQEIRNKAQALFETLTILKSQLVTADNNQSNYLLLLSAEREKFLNGESSVFLINQREQQFADSRNKVIDIQTKIKSAEIELAYTLGIIR